MFYRQSLFVYKNRVVFIFQINYKVIYVTFVCNTIIIITIIIINQAVLRTIKIAVRYK